MQSPDTFDVVVVGAGPTGLAAGLACASLGLKTAVAGPDASGDDGRSAALLDGSINILKRLSVWPRVSGLASPLRAIRIVDASGGLLRAPEVFFDAREIGLPAFGNNIPNVALTEALEQTAAQRLTRMRTAEVRGLAWDRDSARLTTAEGQVVSASLVIAADGRASHMRTAAGIGVDQWSYDQTAVVTTFNHSRPHNGTSTELHRRQGPLTVVPGRDGTSHLVWVDTTAEAARLLSLDDEGFAAALGAHLGGLLGSISNSTRRRAFPITGQRADKFGQRRVALVGEAAHVIPPIGAQGLNLGFRDAATIAEIAAKAKQDGSDIGSDAVLGEYDQKRRGDVGLRVSAVDILNRSLLLGMPGVSLVRGLGLLALASNQTLRQWVMREGVMPAASRPALSAPFAPSEEKSQLELDAPTPQCA